MSKLLNSTLLRLLVVLGLPVVILLWGDLVLYGELKETSRRLESVELLLVPSPTVSEEPVAEPTEEAEAVEPTKKGPVGTSRGGE